MNQKVFRNVQVETIIKEENIMIEDIKKGVIKRKINSTLIPMISPNFKY